MGEMADYYREHLLLAEFKSNMQRMSEAHKVKKLYAAKTLIDEQEQAQQVTNQQPTAFIESVLNTFPELIAEQLYFVERPELAVDEEGKIIEV